MSKAGVVAIAVVSVLASVFTPDAALPQADSDYLRELIREKQKREQEVLPTLPKPVIPGISGEEVGREVEVKKPTITPGLESVLDSEVDPKTYMVGPGDKLTIYLWGQLDQQIVSEVTPEGKILIPTVGEVRISGLSLADARKLITRAVKERYDKVDISVILSKLRLFRVFVSGQVNVPGSYIASPIDRVSDVIERAKGFSDEPLISPEREIERGFPRRRASRRNIELHRGDEVIYVDLRRFQRTGDLRYNPYVRMGDVIYVPVAKRTVDIYGSVYIPGTYEFREGDTLEDLFEIAGGLRPNANLSGVEVVRFREDNVSTETISVDLSANRAMDPPFLLEPDDRVIVRPILGWREKSTVSIVGEVVRPGAYVIEDGVTRLSEVIERAGGFTPNASLVEATVVRQRALIKPDPEYERLLRAPEAEMTHEEKEYLKAKSREQAGRVVVDFQKLFLEGESSEDIVLRGGDLINIPRKSETVTVSGEVRNPGIVRYEPGRSPSYYIEKAGGFSRNADKGNTRVIKVDSGAWLMSGDVRNIDPGDVIWVPGKLRRDAWELFKDTTRVMSEIATAIIVVRTIIGK